MPDPIHRTDRVVDPKHISNRVVDTFHRIVTLLKSVGRVFGLEYSADTFLTWNTDKQCVSP